MTDDFGGGGRPPERGGTDYGTDYGREVGDEPAPAYRDAPPDILSPIDASAPVSGHVRPAESSGASASLTPEHDWTAASAVVIPVLRPAGTVGLRIGEVDRDDPRRERQQGPYPAAGERRSVRPGRRLRAARDGLRRDRQRRASPRLERGAGGRPRRRRWPIWPPGRPSAPWSDEVVRRSPPAELRHGRRDGRCRGSSCPRSASISPASSARPGGCWSGCPTDTCCWPGRSDRATTTSPRSSATTSIEHSAEADEPIDRRVFELRGSGPGRVRGLMPDPGFTSLRWEVADGVGTITLDRPDALNSLEATLKRELLGGPSRGRSGRDGPGRHPDRRRPRVLRWPGPQGAARRRTASAARRRGP